MRWVDIAATPHGCRCGHTWGTAMATLRCSQWGAGLLCQKLVLIVSYSSRHQRVAFTLFHFDAFKPIASVALLRCRAHP